jgi:hypothetical protein
MTEDDRIVQEAKDRFKRCQDWETDFRRLYLLDTKFANADPYNGWQWPDDLRKDREKNKRPALTINKTKQYVLMITNNCRQNKPSINIRPMGQEASYEAAQILEGLVRHIEYISSAQNIYDEATESQVEGGVGYWRIIQRYTDDDSFDQELMISPVRDALSVFIDCDTKQKDASDARYGFVFDDIPEKEFKKQYPDVDFDEVTGTGTGLGETDDWVRSDNIRVAEYYRILEKDDKLIHLEDEHGETAEFKLSAIPSKYRKKWEEAGENYKSRDIVNKQLEWYKIAGSKIIDSRKLKGRYVPLIRVVGIERIIEGRLERKGHVRTLTDPQRMYNYNSSAQVESAAMATKTKWIVPTDAISGNEVAWNNMNRDNAAYLTYKHKDEDGTDMPPPQRIDPAASTPAYLDGMKIAAAEMEMASGQVSQQQQNPAIERTPRAIDAREQKGETATYHFIDNLAIAIRHTGRVLLDLIPHIYDTERTIQILGKDGSQTRVQVSPDIDSAHQVQSERDEVTEVLFNPKVGKYEVESDVGPAYASQRQEAWNAFTQLMTADNQLMNIIGDLAFLSADFPNADKIAERIKRNIRATTPWLLDDQPGPVIAKLNEQIQKQSEQIAELLQKLAENKLAVKGHAEMRDIDAYDAKTRRLTAEGNVVANIIELGHGKQELDNLLDKTMHDMNMDHIDQIQEDNEQNINSQVGGEKG